MIEIKLSDGIKDEIKKAHWEDTCNQQTGLIKRLETAEGKSIIKKYSQLYLYFYDCHKKIKLKNVENLLNGNKNDLVDIIKMLGNDFDKNESKELLEKVFQYDNFSKRSHAYYILQKMNVKVCPYCNRQYTFTLKNKKVRPQFDHYYPKSKYPYLAVSLFNLVPSCSICNQAKTALDTYKEPILYPYEQEFGEEVKFKTEMIKDDISYLHGMSQDFKVVIQNVGNVYTEEVTRQKDILHLEDLYDMHKDYIQDIAKNHYINSPDRIDEIMKRFPKLFTSKEELMSLIYMNDIRKESWGKRPLAKLTKDIYDDLEIRQKTF